MHGKAQRVDRPAQTHACKTQKVTGPIFSPTWRDQVERWTCDLQVVGSNPTQG